MVGAEGAKASAALAGANQRVVPGHLRQGRRQRQRRHGGRCRQRQRRAPDGQVEQVENHDGRHVPLPQGDGGGLDAYLQVIVAVHHGVFGVIRQHPAQVARHQRPGQRRHLPLRGGIGHGNAKAEGHAQHGLRHGHETLGVGVGQRDGQRAERPSDHGGVRRQRQRERRQRQRRAHGQRLACAHAPAGHGALRRALDVPVKLAVGHVIDAAARAAHEDGAQREHRQQVPARKASRRQPQRPERGPQQQQPARRPVPADQVQVKGQAAQRGRGVHGKGGRARAGKSIAANGGGQAGPPGS